MATVLLFATLLAAACSDATGPANPQRNLAGTWTAAAAVPGSSEQWTLSVSGSTVAGSGTWFGEACCSGTVAVAGIVAGDSLHLDLTYTETSPTNMSLTPSMIHIDGILDTPTDLVGVGRRADGLTAPVHFVKRAN